MRQTNKKLANKAPKTANETVSPLASFAGVAAVWLIVGVVWLSIRKPVGNPRDEMFWFLALWVFSVLDLGLLTKAVYALGAAMEAEDASPEKRTALRIQAFFWGLLKLACLGIFGFAMFSVEKPPTASLLLGLGTLVVVTVFGAWHWSQRVIRRA